ncbi:MULTISPECIES: hypothetical protein [unclassified Microcoleus]|uniref:hypothetical protein n=1 Tax=unclassified Microcoleus TaxID=2642155 RepID=UPI002FCF4361
MKLNLREYLRNVGYNNTPAALSDRDRAFLLSVIENPPAPSEGFLALLADY